MAAKAVPVVAARAAQAAAARVAAVLADEAKAMEAAGRAEPAIHRAVGAATRRQSDISTAASITTTRLQKKGADSVLLFKK